MIAVGCGLTWASAAAGIGLAVRLYDRLRKADVAVMDGVSPDTAPVWSPAETISCGRAVAEP